MPPYTPCHPLDIPSPPYPHYRHLVVEWYYYRSAWHVISLLVRLMFHQMYPSPPMSPWCPQVEASSGQEWYELASHWPELMFYCLQCSIDHLEFSRVHPHPQYRHLVLKSGTTAGQHDIWSDCGSGWCLVRCTPPPHHPPMPLNAPPTPPPQYRHLVVKSSITSGQFDIWSAFGSGWPIYARENLVPAATVIPAPWLDIKVVAVK